MMAPTRRTDEIGSGISFEFI